MKTGSPVYHGGVAGAVVAPVVAGLVVGLSVAFGVGASIAAIASSALTISASVSGLSGWPSIEGLGPKSFRSAEELLRTSGAIGEILSPFNRAQNVGKNTLCGVIFPVS